MILGLDIASCTGWCMGSGAEIPTLGHINMPSTGDEIGPFLDVYDRWLKAKLDVLVSAAAQAGTNPLVVFEAPFLPKAKYDRATGKLIQAPVNIATTRKLQCLAGVTELLCHRAKVMVREEHIGTVKLGLSGSGKADKLQMMAAAKGYGVAPANFDEADAFGVWLVGGVRKYAKAHAKRWAVRSVA